MPALTRMKIIYLTKRKSKERKNGEDKHDSLQQIFTRLFMREGDKFQDFFCF